MSTSTWPVSAQVHLPSYRSHKAVRAIKISGVAGIPGTNGAALIVPGMGSGVEPFQTPEGWMDRFGGTNEDPGYFVEYEDGYASWSPSAAFEAGYTAIG